MASCEVINCQRMQIQCREKVSAVAIDKTDGIIVFLPTTSLGRYVHIYVHTYMIYIRMYIRTYIRIYIYIYIHL
jgi:hypothetical protein